MLFACKIVPKELFSSHMKIIENTCSALRKKKESQNGSPRRAIWLSVTQLTLELHFGATLLFFPKHDYEEKKRLALSFFFSQCVGRPFIEAVFMTKRSES